MMENENVNKETEYKETRELKTRIEKLTDDCLIEIFQRLQTIADKIRIERVCKRWKCLSQRSWNNFKSLDFSAKTWGLEVDCPYPKLIRTLDFDKIIRLSGRYLTSISIDVDKFSRICHLLPNIRKLQLYHVQFWVMSHGENLTNFKIQVEHSHFREEDFASLIGNMEKLKSCSLDNLEYLDWSGTFLVELPLEKLQEFILTSGYGRDFDIDLLPTMIQKCEKLHTLGVFLERCENPEILKFLPRHAASLKNLKLRLGFTWSRQWESVILSTLSALMNLEKLDLSECYCLNDEFLGIVARNCKKLTYLKLGGSDKVTDRGISSICNLENLAYLSIGAIEGISNPRLDKVKSLVVLDLCLLFIQEECLCTFLREAHQLRALNIITYSLVSKKILNVAIEVAQTRKSNNALDLYIWRTRINMADLDDKPPFLNIIDSFDVPLSKYGIRDPFSFKRPAVHVVSDIL